MISHLKYQLISNIRLVDPTVASLFCCWVFQSWSMDCCHQIQNVFMLQLMIQYCAHTNALLQISSLSLIIPLLNLYPILSVSSLIMCSFTWLFPYVFITQSCSFSLGIPLCFLPPRLRSLMPFIQRLLLSVTFSPSGMFIVSFLSTMAL